MWGFGDNARGQLGSSSGCSSCSSGRSGHDGSLGPASIKGAGAASSRGAHVSQPTLLDLDGVKAVKIDAGWSHSVVLGADLLLLSS